MIVADSSVIIANLRNEESRETRDFREYSVDSRVIIGDLVLLEILQGARSEEQASKLAANFQLFPKGNMLDQHIAIEAARNFRQMRALGITIRKTTDLIIGTYCIVEDHFLLHKDRDFDPMQRHLGLKVA
jgi:predicted nucleic acid-binding protein